MRVGVDFTTTCEALSPFSHATITDLNLKSRKFKFKTSSPEILTEVAKTS
jgi:hypothetical protein